MKKFIYVIALFTSVMNAQVGIGTTTPSGALEVNSAMPLPSTQKAGLVPPTVALSATNSTVTTTAGVSVINPLTNGVPTTGTIVYNTNTSAAGANQVTPGYYFYNGTLWEKMATGGQTSTSYFTTASTAINTGTALTYLSGFPVNIDVPTNTTIMVSSDVGVLTNNNGNAGFSMVDIVLLVDGTLLTNGGYQRVMPANNANTGGTIDYASFSQSIELTPGTHTIGLAAAGTGVGNNATVGGDNTSVLQGEVTVTILKK